MLASYPRFSFLNEHTAPAVHENTKATGLKCSRAWQCKDETKIMGSLRACSQTDPYFLFQTYMAPLRDENTKAAGLQCSSADQRSWRHHTRPARPRAWLRTLFRVRLRAWLSADPYFLFQTYMARPSTTVPSEFHFFINSNPISREIASTALAIVSCFTHTISSIY